MIKIENLKVGIGEKEILKGVSLEFELGKNYCLLGKNGSGKSTLVSFLMGHPKYDYIKGNININGKKLLKMSPDERSKEGLFLSFQNIPEIKGIILSEYLRTIYNISKISFQGFGKTSLQAFGKTSPQPSPLEEREQEQKGEFKGLSPFLFKRFIKKYLDELDIDESFLLRELNVGFSGGEKRKIEILQMKLIGPKYIILDEIDSGLDMNAFKTIAEILRSISSKYNSLIIITHYFKIFEYINVDKVYIMKDGMIVKEGDMSLIKEISEKGFEN